MTDKPVKQLADSGGGAVVAKTLTNKNKDIISPLKIDINNFGMIEDYNGTPKFFSCMGLYDNINFILIKKDADNITLDVANNSRTNYFYDVTEDGNDYVIEDNFNRKEFNTMLLHNMENEDYINGYGTTYNVIYNIARINIYLIDDSITDYYITNILRFRNGIANYIYYSGMNGGYKYTFYYSGTIYDNNNAAVKEVTATIEYKFWEQDTNKKYKIIIPKNCFTYQ